MKAQIKARLSSLASHHGPLRLRPWQVLAVAVLCLGLADLFRSTVMSAG